jgi:hypothetical protein
MKELINNTFILISSLKNIDKKLILDKDDEKLLKAYYNAYDINKICSFRLYKASVIQFAIKLRMSLHKTCELLTKEITK